MDDTYDANVRIKDLPRKTDTLLSALAAIQKRSKWEVVRDAIVEYVDRHKAELVDEASS